QSFSLGLFKWRRRPPTSPLFPYPTLFRSQAGEAGRGAQIGVRLRDGEDVAHSPRDRMLFTIAGGGAGRRGLHGAAARRDERLERDRKSTRLNSSHVSISYAVFCL